MYGEATKIDLLFILSWVLTSMFNVDVDCSANAPPLPSLKEHRCIGLVLWEQQLY